MYSQFKSAVRQADSLYCFTSLAPISPIEKPLPPIALISRVVGEQAANRRSTGIWLMIAKTTPPGRRILLYDGHCRFCQAGAKKLLRLAKPGTVDLVSFQDPGVLDRFPGLTYEDCMKQMILITPEGRVIGGVEAGVEALATRPWIGWLARAYYIPGLHRCLDRAYAWIAAHRYKLMGKTIAEGGCEGGTCALHFPPAKAKPG